jgi:hypothetical protein
VERKSQPVDRHNVGLADEAAFSGLAPRLAAREPFAHDGTDKTVNRNLSQPRSENGVSTPALFKLQCRHFVSVALELHGHYHDIRQVPLVHRSLEYSRDFDPIAEVDDVFALVVCAP